MGSFWSNETRNQNTHYITPNGSTSWCRWQCGDIGGDLEPSDNHPELFTCTLQTQLSDLALRSRGNCRFGK